MAHFHGKLDLQQYRSEWFKLLSPFGYTTDHFGTAVDLIAPVGFISDLASIPKLLRSLISVIGRHMGAAVIHDYLYKTANIHNWSRFTCDKIWLEAMEVARVPRWKRIVMYRAVRLSPLARRKFLQYRREA